MRILHICPLYYPSIGGSQAHVQSLSETLATLGISVSVFTCNTKEPKYFHSPQLDNCYLQPYECVNAVEVHRFKINYRLFRFLVKLRSIRGGFRLSQLLLRDTYGYWQNGPLTLGMIKAVVKCKPDVIMATNNYGFGFFLSIFLKRIVNKPLVLIPITHTAQSWCHDPIVRKVLAKAELVIACTDFEKKFLIQQGLCEKKIRVVPLAIDLEDFPAQTLTSTELKAKFNLKDDPVIAYIGRKSKGKGIESLIRSMRMVWKKFPTAQLLLAGKDEADFIPLLNQELNKLEPSERMQVKILNEFTEQEKKDLYGAIDTLCMVSDVDAFGLVYLEAWANQKVVIAKSNSPQADIIDHGRNGLLVDYNNDGQLADALLTLLENPSMRQEMGRHGYDKVQREYNLKLYSQKIKFIYEDLVSKS